MSEKVSTGGSNESFSAAELQAFADEALPAARMAAIEDALRRRPEVAKQLAQVLGARDAGLHTVGEIWRRHRLTCPSRAELGGYLLDVLEPGQASYIQFHLEQVGCRVCQANVADLERLHGAISRPTTEPDMRRRKFFQSSAGLLRKR